MSNLFKKVTLTHAIIFTILFAASFTVINYSGIGVAGLLNITGGASVLDFERGYSIVKAQNVLASLGTEGQEFYLAKLIPLDYIFPLTYMLFYSGWIAIRCNILLIGVLLIVFLVRHFKQRQ